MLFKLSQKINFRNTLPIILVIFACIAGIVFLQKPLLNNKSEITLEEYQRQQSLTSTKLNLINKLPTFGFDNLLASWLYLDFIQYYGDGKARKATDYSLIPNYFKSLVELDPRFVKAYLYVEPANSLFAGKPDISVDLINKILPHIDEKMPFAYQLWFYKGIDELLFLGKTKDAENSYRQGAKWARIANTKHSLAVADRAEETANFLADNPDSTSARIGSWLMILGNANDDETRNIALENLKKLGAEVVIEGNVLSVKVPQEID